MRLRKRALAHIFRSETRMQRAHFRFLQPKKFLLYRFFDYLCTANRGVEQLAARWAHNPKVGGSSPPPATKKESNVFGEGTLLFCFTTLKPSQKVDPDCRVINRPQDTSLTPAPPLLHPLLSSSQPYPANDRTQQLLRQPTSHAYPSRYHSFLSTPCLHLSISSLHLSVVIHTFIILTIGPRSNIV